MQAEKARAAAENSKAVSRCGSVELACLVRRDRAVLRNRRARPKRELRPPRTRRARGVCLYVCTRWHANTIVVMVVVGGLAARTRVARRRAVDLLAAQERAKLAREKQQARCRYTRE